jgi:uncharacterized protein (DUF885 family)
MGCKFERAGIALIAVSLALFPIPAAAQTPHDDIQKLLQHYFDTKLEDEPEFATTTGHFDNADKWNDWSKAGREMRRKHAEETLSELRKFPASGLSDADSVSLRLLKYDLQLQLDAEDLETHLIRVGPLFGLHTRVYTTVDRMPARTVRDYENLLARLHGIPAYVDQNIDLLKESIASGMMQPQVVVELLIKQVTAQTQQTAETTPLLIAFRHFPSNFPAEQQTKLREEALQAYEKEFLPAWKRLLEFLQTTYAPKVRPNIGLSSLPKGREYYAIMVRRLTTTNASPEEIHKIGESEVQRLESEMLAVAWETGFTGSLSEFDKKLDATPETHFRSKDEMLIYCRNTAKIIEPELPNQFKHIPLLLFGVRAIPEDREQATASNAQAPAPDGSVPGWFNLNTYEPEKQVRYNKETLTLHEAIPGHIFQGSLARSQQNLPEFRRFYGNSAYAEGWALYAESLGSQLGLYRDPYSRYGRLASERFRAVRLVVDTGMHSMGWTRDQAIEYFHAHAPEVSLAEVDRYISWPAQALAYKMGQLKILELRKEGEQKLGAKFDVRDFHDAVLRDGTLPLELLQEQVEKYINGVK